MLLHVTSDDLNPGQLAFLESTDPFVLLSGGYGAGKTLGLTLKMFQLMTENPGVNGLLVAPTWGSLKSVSLNTMHGLLRNSGVGWSRLPRIIDPTGEAFLDFGRNKVFVRSAHRPEGLEGLDVGWLIGDEVRYWSRQAYEVAIARVRVKCPRPQRAFASTPSIGVLSDEFDSGREGRRLIVAPTTENLRNLNEDYVRNLEISYSKRMQDAVLRGLFTVLEGAVFEDFDSGKDSPWITDWQPSSSFLESHPVHLAVDPGFRRSAWLFIVEVGHLDWIVFDQIMPENTSDASCVEVVNAKGYPIDEIWMDPAGEQVQSVEGRRTVDMLRNIKPRTRNTRLIRAIDKFRSISFGIERLRVLLGGDELPIRIRFTRALADKERGQKRGIVKDLSMIRYPEIKDGRPVSDLPLKDGITDHSCDALRYWAVGRYLTVPELRNVLIKHEGLRTNTQGYRAA